MFRHRWFGLVIMAWLLMPAVGAGADEMQIDLAGRVFMVDGLIFGRQCAVQYTLENGPAFRLLNDSYEYWLYGQDIRWGLTSIFPLVQGDLRLWGGTGFSLTSASGVPPQLSWDIFGRLAYGVFFLQLDNLIYRDGLLADDNVGVEWLLWNERPRLALIFQIGSLIIVDGSGSNLCPGVQAGIRTEF